MINPKVQVLANLLRDRKKNGDPKFVLLLGAGASMSSGVKKTPEIMQELLAAYALDIDPQLALGERFDRLWQRTPPAQQEKWLGQYLNVEPSEGYEKLARLIAEDYFDVILTLNFDDLVEKSLDRINCKHSVLTQGETVAERMETLVHAADPRVKLLKLHGNLKGAEQFKFASEELLHYPAPVANLVKSLTSRDVIICGYSFQDFGLQQAFALSGGYVFCVEPREVNQTLRGIMRKRGSGDFHVPCKFDDFFDQLHRELLAPPPPPPGARARPVANPFKFLESHNESERAVLYERDEAIDKFMKALAIQPPLQLIVLAGPPKAGKTSLIKAGIVPALNGDLYRHHYLRCRATGAEPLHPDLGDTGIITDPAHIRELVQNAAADAGHHRAVLFVDRFEQLTAQFKFDTDRGREALDKFLDEHVFSACAPNVTLVLVVADQGGGLGAALSSAAVDRDVPARLVQVRAFDRDQIVSIITSLAKTAGIDLAPAIIDDLANRYEENRNRKAEDHFTLAHIHAVCHLLVRSPTLDLKTLQAFDNLGLLHKAINVCNVVSWADDFAWPNADVLRNLFKVPLRESKEKIAEYIMANYDEFLPRPNPKMPKALAGVPDAR